MNEKKYVTFWRKSDKDMPHKPCFNYRTYDTYAHDIDDIRVHGLCLESNMLFIEEMYPVTYDLYMNKVDFSVWDCWDSTDEEIRLFKLIYKLKNV